VVGDQIAEKEYLVFGDEEEETEDDEFPGELVDEDALKASLDQMPPIDFGDVPPPQTIEEAIALVENNPEVRSQIAKALSEQFGIPRFMADMLLQNLGGLEKMIGEGLPGEAAAEVGDAGQAMLDELALSADHKVAYVYGDEEWLFDVAVEAVEPANELQREYPLILDGEGDAPQQFAFWDDDDESEDWDDAEEDEDF